MKQIIYILFIFAQLQSMQSEVILSKLWNKTFEQEIPSAIHPEIANLLINQEKILKQTNVDKSCIKTFLRLRPKSTSHTFHVIMQLLAYHYKENPSLVQHEFENELASYDPHGMQYIEIYRELLKKYSSGACLCHRFTEYIQHQKDQFFKRAVLNKDEATALELLESGANPDQKVEIPITCSPHCACCWREELIPTVSIVPLTKLCSSMPNLQRAITERLAKKQTL